jgi:hypothetical protein
MDLSKYTGGGSKFLVWILLIIIVVGFGKGSKFVGVNFPQPGKTYTPPRGAKGGGTYPVKGLAGLGGVFNSNLIFILIVVAILFIAKDKKVGSTSEGISDPVITVDCEETSSAY